MSFKLLAIRPLEGCNKKFLKNLKPDQIYQLYNDYDFSEYPSKSQIKYEKENNIDIYSSETIKINISAIVGKNGSGKSSLLDIFYAFVFCLANSKEIELINDETFIKEHSLDSTQKENYQNDLIELKGLFCEIFYLIDDDLNFESKIYCINKGETFSVKTLDYNNKGYYEKKKSPVELSKFKLSDLSKHFFYSIIANYSLYGMNTTENGIWLKSLFHKNDGYQTPMVLNPMRTDGNIDINKVTYLSKARLLSNILKPLEKPEIEENSLRCLVNKKIVNKLFVKLDYEKFKKVTENEQKKFQHLGTDEYLIELDKGFIINPELSYRFYDFKNDLLLELFNAFKIIDEEEITDIKSILNESKIHQITVEYILRKVKTITEKYSEYKEYKFKVFKINSKKSNIREYFDKLSEDQSHIVFKLRQAINFLRYNIFEINDLNQNVYIISDLSKSIKRKIDELIDQNTKGKDSIMKSFEEANFKYNLIYFLPPSFFEFDFEFKEEGFFKDLSSGEKQMIYSLASVTYHLFNLKSINPETKIRYNYFNIIFDEIELYFHPEFQRIYINELLKSIRATDLRFEGINVIFSTHSPFILSDIPKQNILFLDDGKPDDYKRMNTFGANITDLLSDSFFISEGLIGEFAKRKIQITLEWLKKEANTKQYEFILDYKIVLPEFELRVDELKYHKQTIALIDEPLVKEKLKRMYLEFVTDDTTYKNEKIANLKMELEKLERK